MLFRSGQLVEVVSWGRILAEVQGCLDEVSDESGLANLAQLWGLCDRADAEAMLPIHPSEIGSEVAHRLCDLLDIVDGVTDELVRRKKVSLRGLRSVGGKGYYGRGIKSEDSGHTLQLCLLSYSWAYRYPTPIWLRIWKPSRSAVNAWASLEGTDGIPFSDSDQSDGWIRLGLSVPMGVESDQVVARLAENVERAMAALPRDASAEEAHAMPDSMDSDLPSDLDPQG